jgi:hypothetical protein
MSLDKATSPLGYEEREKEGPKESRDFLRKT